MSTMEREFLGWGQMPLERAASWLVEHFGQDLQGILVALPGARSGRILMELLAREAGAALRPPTVVTAGLLSDALLDVEGTPAGRLARTLAWARALRDLEPALREKILARAPGDGEQDLAGWVPLAEQVRGLFGEVAAEGLLFAQVAESEALAGVEGERRRWLALAAAQEGMRELITAAGLVDPHLGRLAAIEQGRAREVRGVVLVGVAESNALLRRALDLCQAPATALIFAPEDLADSFDTYGCLVPSAWASYHTSLVPKEQWHVVDGPASQAQQATRVIAGWQGRYAPEAITIGIADHEVAPYMRGALAVLGVVARDAAGTPLGQTAPVLLLGAVGAFLNGTRFRDFANLVRHPDFESALRSQDGCRDLQPVNIVDQYHNAHLPWDCDGDWRADSDDERDRRLRADMEQLWKAAGQVLGELRGTGDAPLSDQIPKLRQLLALVFGGRGLDPAVEADRILKETLSRLGNALAEVESLPPELVPRGGASAAIELLLRVVSGEQVPPAGVRGGEATIEMLGWLELALDDAPALVVTGFEDGKVPESVHGDAYLPDRLRQSLGLVDNQQRLARDLYATELLLQSRSDVAFISGRRSLAGDSQVPSRIVFHCDDEQVAPRVRRFLEGGQQTAARVDSRLGAARELPRMEQDAEVLSISVTGFKLFLQSPYLFYLEKVAKLKTLDDRARELDPMGFGILAHDVLQAFGNDETAREETDAQKIALWLGRELERLGNERFGPRPLPAVRVQLEQLAYRLQGFAQVQADRRKAGWQIVQTEWEPKAGHHAFPVDGTPIHIRGRIDRIDRNEKTGAWAIWDYKTGEKIKKPITVHRAIDGSWKDLQLPLYCLLATELLGEAEPAEIGYIGLPRDLGDIDFMPLSNNWCRKKNDTEEFGEGLQSALETVSEVVCKIRAGDFFSSEGFAPRDPILAAIGGVGLIAQDPDESEADA